MIQGLLKLCLLKTGDEELEVNEPKLVYQILGLIGRQNNEGMGYSVLFWVCKEIFEGK